jgi:2,4-dienoyl-CoA reductase-like NADH-dependent reductase (Old Yellow Enzyme family)
MMAEYYAQRAAAGLIISEGIPVSRQGVGYARVPGLWNDEQMQAWKPVTRAVHEAGGRIFAQLWHVGRISHPSFNRGRTPVAPSAIRPQGHVSLLRPLQDYVQPRALTPTEIVGVVESFRSAAVRALEAGFDGVELHGANGYLLDQFLQDGTNLRDDGYGGPVENRARLMLEATDAAISAWGPNRVGVHLSPRGDIHEMGDSNRSNTFGHLAEQLGNRGIAFLCVRERVAEDSILPLLKYRFNGPIIANEGFTKESAQEAISQGWADAVAFGNDYIANPDLVERLRNDAPLSTGHADTTYTHGAEGYLDSPTTCDQQIKET